MSGVTGRLIQGSAPQISAINWNNSIDNNKSTKTKTAGKNTTPSDRTNDKPKNKSSHNEDNISSKNNTVDSQQKQDVKTIKEQTKQTKQEKKNLLCPWTDCPKCQDCAYPKASVNVDNDSQKLWKAYKLLSAKQKDDFDRYYDEIADDYNFAAHHIISGNQVFKPHAEIVRLANFYGYDINCAQNCIPLVSKEDDYGKIKLKNVNAYETMSLSGIQWHLGGHSYTFAKEDIESLRQRVILYTKQQVKSSLKNYAQLLTDELAKMEQSLAARKVCRDTPQQKMAFIKRMNNLSVKIKNKLAAFREKPHYSYPYYVSKEAFLYTFNLPRTGKLILVNPIENNQLTLEKFRVERFADTIAEKDKSLKFKTKGTETFALDDSNNVLDKKSCIAFCDNVEHFIFIDKAHKALPFTVEYSKVIEYSPLSSQQMLNLYDTDIMVWLRDNQSTYIAPLKKIKQRLKECNL